ncbi:MAG: Asp-tRNA(Asn)/Glu-tRNA(Gln) amidotransferase subunit GatA, partial [Clostridiales bacterium]|nr:Asp-tRNA(Asn)/Glu-tRNA(Gln) amidotransferase subunit GatA [Clostridiales bacterium]
AGNYEKYFAKSKILQKMICDEFAKIFEKCDVILSPVLSKAAYKFGEERADDFYTVPANIAGLPAISVPFGRNEINLPVGIQLIAKRFNDGKLLSLANAFERERGDL